MAARSLRFGRPTIMLTVQQLSELQEAVEDAHAFANRRRNPRFRYECNAEMSPWENNRALTAFNVVVENLSTTGVGIRHNGRLKEGGTYLLEIPRPGNTPLRTLLTVVRCDENDGGWFDVEMAPDEVLQVTVDINAHRCAPGARRSPRLKLGLVVTAFVLSALAMLVLLV
jgi:hypothetical protein